MSYPSDAEYPRRVVVDDTDPRIKYEQGDWTVDNHSFDDITIHGLPYNGTMHGTTSSTASFSFQFEGEFVQVRGAKDNRKVTRPDGTNNDNSTLLAKWTCQVDGSSIKTTGYRPFMFDVTNNMLCEQGKLSRGPHTLTVNVTLDDPNTQAFWLDQVEFTPLLDADLAKEVLKFDSSDPAIQVDNSTRAWKSISNLFNGTGTTGASATFRFNGTSVSLYGFNEGSDKNWEATTGRYYIDNKGDTNFDIAGSKPLPGLPNNKTDYYNQLWFSTPKLDPGTHEMVITYTGVAKGSDPAQWLSIDYFYVTASEGSKLDAGPPAGGGGSGGGGGGGGGSEQSNGQTDSKSNAGGIAGGVIGGVIGLALIGFGIFFFLKKRREKESYGQYDGFQPQNMYGPPTIQPPVSSGPYAGYTPGNPAGAFSSGGVSSPDGFSGPSGFSTMPYAGTKASRSSGALSPGSTSSGMPTSSYDPYRDLASSPNQTGSHSIHSGSNSVSEVSRNSMVVANPGAGPSRSHNWNDMKSAQRDAENVGDESHLILIHDESEEDDNGFEFEDGDDDLLQTPVGNAPPLSPSLVFLYLLSPYLKLGTLLLPNVALSLKFGLPALFIFAILSAFARQIWFMLSRYVRKDDLTDVVVDIFARGRGKRRRRKVLRAVVQTGNGLLRVLLSVIYIRVSAGLLLPLFSSDFPSVSPAILSIIIGVFLFPICISQSLSSRLVIYSTWGSIFTFVLWFICATYAYSKGTLEVNKAWLAMGPLWTGITTIAYAFTASNTLTLAASLKASIRPTSSATRKRPLSHSFKFLSVLSVTLALLFALPLVVFAAFPNRLHIDIPASRIRPFRVFLNAATLLLGVPSILVTVPKVTVPERVRWRTPIPISRILTFIVVLFLSNVPSVVRTVFSDLLIAFALSSTYFLPALLHIVNHFFRRPLSIIMPSQPNTPVTASASPVDEPQSARNDPLLQRKEKALQKKQWKRRLIWDLGVWTLLLPVGGGGFVWAMGTLFGNNE
ncbi:hypothetical protein V5O48_005047 [Marasmius crinis-equi]|uniref:Uncharacterized protein n=1 Tax=Marasmius crinis-equi TaxID=585013 RepID=A0ABR3FND8_9AGAR